MFKILLIYLLTKCSSEAVRCMTTTTSVESTAATVDPVFRDDYKYYENVHGWIKLHTVPANWHDARLRCWAEGAALASPIDSNLRDTMTSVMVTESTNPNHGVYSGIHSTFSNGSYLTIEGVAISALPVCWATGQPDHVYTENCVVYHMNGTLEDVQCADEFEYICYKKFETLTMNQCKTVDNEYKWDGKTGHCYKLHPHGQNWSRAHMICTAEGGYLTVINSEIEAEVLRELFAKYPAQTIVSPYKDYVFIGIREWPDEGSWYTVQGKTLNEAGYSTWNAEPDNLITAGETQDCGMILRNALMEDFWCSMKLAFICEKDL